MPGMYRAYGTQPSRGLPCPRNEFRNRSQCGPMAFRIAFEEARPTSNCQQ